MDLTLRMKQNTQFSPNQSPPGKQIPEAVN